MAGIESATFISDLNVSNPAANDQISQGDDHLRLLKTVVKNTFPNATVPFAFPSVVAKTHANTPYSANTNTDRNSLEVWDLSGGACAAVLPDATSGGGAAGYVIGFKKTDNSANALTISTSLGQTIDGAATYVISVQNDLVWVVSDGANWWTKEKFLALPTAVAASAVTLAMMANLGQSTIIGRAAGAGTGVPTALTPAQIAAIGPSPLKGVQVFTTGSGTYTPSANATSALVIVTGGGGGGGGSGSTTTASAAGGGGGATAFAFVAALASVAYVVDAGGAGGIATGGTGAAGGTSSFGTITAGGGLGGTGATSTGAGSSVAGGAGSATTANATFTIPGTTGNYGFVDNAAGVGVDLSGYGGGSFWGMGGASRPTDVLGAGLAGVVPGSGGGGANRNNVNVIGGAGAPGIVVVFEF